MKESRIFTKIILLLLSIPTLSLGQDTYIYIGTTVSNFTEENLDKANPYFGVIYFFKENNVWKTSNDTFYKNRDNVNFYYKGIKIGENKIALDTVINISPYFLFPYKFENKKIPKLGEKSFEFSGMDDNKRFRPILFSNEKKIGYRINPMYRNANSKDSLLLIKYLIETAKNLNLGNLDSLTKPLINSVNKVFVVNKNCYFIEADINLNMYCYGEKVPFNTDLNYFMTRVERYSVSERKFTDKSYFLVANSKVSYIDYRLKYLDSGDFDNDGFEEIIFRMDKYNYSAYLMVTNKWTEFLVFDWSYH